MFLRSIMNLVSFVSFRYAFSLMKLRYNMSFFFFFFFESTFFFQALPLFYRTMPFVLIELGGKYFFQQFLQRTLHVA